MTDLSPILPKLEKLVPRLASDADGEVVSTVRAIDRTLRGAGLDWHDFTSALGPALPPPRPAPRPRPPQTLREIADWCAFNGAYDLSTKELEFVLSMARRLRSRQASEKQAQWLRDIYEKLRGTR